MGETWWELERECDGQLADNRSAAVLEAEEVVYRHCGVIGSVGSDCGAGGGRDDEEAW